MATRRDAREWAFQYLFQYDFNPEDSSWNRDRFWAEKETDARTRRFAEELIEGVLQNREDLDRRIVGYAEHWDLDRMSGVDRNVMRMALYEMLYRPDIPPIVSINEAVDIAKHFSTDESGRFVNGILDRARKDLKRPSRTAEGGEKKTAWPSGKAPTDLPAVDA